MGCGLVGLEETLFDGGSDPFRSGTLGGTRGGRYSDRKCADTTGTVPVPWAGHFQR